MGSVKEVEGSGETSSWRTAVAASAFFSCRAERHSCNPLDGGGTVSRPGWGRVARNHPLFCTPSSSAVVTVGVRVRVCTHPNPAFYKCLFSTRLDYGLVSNVRPLGFILYLPSWYVVSCLPSPSVPQAPFD